MSTFEVQDFAALRLREHDGLVLAAHGDDWSSFRQAVRARLRADGYRSGTLRVYRQVLRDLRKFLAEQHGSSRPADLTTGSARAYMEFLCLKNVSWSWMATVIAVLRNCFDRLGGLHVTSEMVTPRRKWPLPETLSERELRLLFDALAGPRDRLLAALLAGCGLRISEACRVRWMDFDRTAKLLRLEDPAGLRSRSVIVPPGLLPLFEGLAAVSRSSDPMICIYNHALPGLPAAQGHKPRRSGPGRKHDPRGDGATAASDGDGTLLTDRRTDRRCHPPTRRGHKSGAHNRHPPRAHYRRAAIVCNSTHLPAGPITRPATPLVDASN